MRVEELEPASVEYPLVRSVRNPRFGVVFEASRVVCRELRFIIRLRRWIQSQIDRRPILTCGKCGTPVYLRSSVRKRWFFRHVNGASANCEWAQHAAKDLDEINADRYNGAKEGPKHQRMKRLVRSSLEADTRFSDIHEEKRWTGTFDPTTWRVPDLDAAYAGLRIAFEMQPSATYINVIQDRSDYYLKERALLFWIFPPLVDDGLRLYQEDVFLNNNSNMFIVDEETAATSIATGKFSLRCHYYVPSFESGAVVDTPHSKIVAMDDLTIEQGRQRVYYFDYWGERVKVQQRATSVRIENLRAQLEAFWLKHGGRYNSDADVEYQEICDAIRLAGGPQLPDAYWVVPFCTLMSLLYSAKHGRSIGFGHTTLIEVAHTAFQHHKTFLYPFGWVCRLHGTDELLRQQDRKSRLHKKRLFFKRALQCRDPAFMPNVQFVPVIDFMFPGIGERLMREREKWGAAG